LKIIKPEKIKLRLNETNIIEYSEFWKYKKIIHTVFCSSLAGTLITKTRQNIIALKNDFFTEKNLPKNLLFDETFTFLFLSLTNRPSVQLTKNGSSVRSSQLIAAAAAARPFVDKLEPKVRPRKHTGLKTWWFQYTVVSNVNFWARGFPSIVICPLPRF
jgi:hypothetical protein